MLKLALLLYFADKEHLVTYGRPVTGDRYIRMEMGPVPSNGYALMKREERALPEHQSLFDERLEIRDSVVAAKGNADIRHLSETDLEILDSVVARYGALTATALSSLSQSEVAWQRAERNGDIDYRLVFTTPDSRAVRDLVQQDQELRDALADVTIDEPVPVLHS
jgi:uncharacterized phage-associated protein